jgi:hypothetical protein
MTACPGDRAGAGEAIRDASLFWAFQPFAARIRPAFKGTVQELMESVVGFTYWSYNGWGMGSGPCKNPPWGPGPYPETQWK